MLSRIAENLYWIGRYMERAENTSRLLDANYYAMAEAPVGLNQQELLQGQWMGLVLATGTEARFFENYKEATQENTVEWLAFNQNNPSSLKSALRLARDNARTVRYHLNLEMWESVNRGYNALLQAQQQDVQDDSLHDYCVGVRDGSHLFFGIAEASLPADMGWHFMLAGRYIERMDSMLRALRVRLVLKTPSLGKAVEDHLGRAFLRSVGAFEAYRKKFHHELDWGVIVDFLLTDPHFPRSVKVSGRKLHQAVEELSRLNPGSPEDLVRRSGRCWARLEFLPEENNLSEAGGEALMGMIQELWDLSDAITKHYFALGPSAFAATSQLHLQ